LLSNGAKVLDVDQEKCTPLHLACKESVSDVVKVLLEKCDPIVKPQVDALQYAE
jgi:ankyrin repeat protein